MTEEKVIHEYLYLRDDGVSKLCSAKVDHRPVHDMSLVTKDYEVIDVYDYFTIEDSVCIDCVGGRVRLYCMLGPIEYDRVTRTIKPMIKREESK